jgi:HAD superfamily 5'-nucleotidase-like hydrolase
MPNGNGLIEAKYLDELEPTPIRDLLLHASADQPPPWERQVFVNRNLRMEKIRHIGLDLDWTLADYHRDAMSELAFERTLDRLVERHGYPRSVLDAEFRADFSRRGLMIDKDAGMVVKMNRHRYVGRAYHGRRFLDTEERARLYRTDPIHPSSPRFYFVDTLFELPEVNIFSELIEMADRGPKKLEVPFPRLFQDIRQAIDTIHADGSLKDAILADLPRYLPRDPRLALALERMALGGRRLLLITNSEWFYTDAVCSYLFEDSLSGLGSWRELFDLVVVQSGKPGFFRKATPFVELDDEGREIGEVEVPRWGGLYKGGSREHLMRLLDAPGEQVLYIGDHIYGDVVSSKLSSTWRTALVVTELEEELVTRRNLAQDLHHLDVLRAEVIRLGQRMDDLGDVLVLFKEANGRRDGPAPALDPTRDLLSDLKKEHRVMRRQVGRLQGRISRAINPYWGSLFKQGDSKSLFGSQVHDFACVYTSQVANFASYGTNHYFRVLHDTMIHESRH